MLTPLNLVGSRLGLCVCVCACVCVCVCVFVFEHTMKNLSINSPGHVSLHLVCGGFLMLRMLILQLLLILSVLLPSSSLLTHSGKWTICFFMPENSPVRKKMIMASSTGALKEGLGET
jgi:hypothetical protein